MSALLERTLHVLSEGRASYICVQRLTDVPWLKQKTHTQTRKSSVVDHGLAPDGAGSENGETTEVHLLSDSVGDQALGDAGLGEILAGIRESKCNITHLFLDFCGITDKGALNLCRFLRDSKVLYDLSLVCNAIGEDGSVQLAACFESKKGMLEAVDLTGNPMTVVGARALVDAFEANPRLKSFDIAGVPPGLVRKQGNGVSPFAETPYWEVGHESWNGVARRLALLMRIRELEGRLAEKNAPPEDVSIPQGGNKPSKKAAAPSAIGYTFSFPPFALHLSGQLGRRNDAALERLTELLVRENAVTTVDFSDSGFDNEHCLALSTLITSCKSLRILDVEDNFIANRGIGVLAMALEQRRDFAAAVSAAASVCDKRDGHVSRRDKYHSEVDVYMTGNPVSTEGVEIAFSAGLHLGNYRKSGRIVSHLPSGIGESTRVVDLSNCIFKPSESQRLATFIKATGCPYRELRMAGCALSLHALQILVEALAHNTTIRLLDLQGAQVKGHEDLVVSKSAQGIMESPGNWSLLSSGNDLAAAIAAALPRNTSIRKLDLRECGIGDEGVHLLAKALIDNSTITDLQLEMNAITNVGAEYLQKALTSHPSLQSVSVNWNNMSVEANLKVQDVLHQNQLSTTSWRYRRTLF